MEKARACRWISMALCKMLDGMEAFSKGVHWLHCGGGGEGPPRRSCEGASQNFETHAPRPRAPEHPRWSSSEMSEAHFGQQRQLLRWPGSFGPAWAARSLRAVRKGPAAAGRCRYFIIREFLGFLYKPYIAIFHNSLLEVLVRKEARPKAKIITLPRSADSRATAARQIFHRQSCHVEAHADNEHAPSSEALYATTVYCILRKNADVETWLTSGSLRPVHDLLIGTGRAVCGDGDLGSSDGATQS